jgi:membrane protein DedA with SNARE-associated domain
VSISEQLLAAVLTYGLPVLFGVLVFAAIGFPIPVSVLLVAAGSFVKQGEMAMVPVMLVATSATILGDNIGYGISFWGGRRLVDRITDRFGGAEKLKKAEALSNRWGAAGIFLSRWLITVLGPWINITSGLSGYPWPQFAIWAALGKVVWVVLYVMLGYIFSDRVQYLAEILGNMAWFILGIVVAILLGVKVLRYLRAQPEEDEAAKPRKRQVA